MTDGTTAGAVAAAVAASRDLGLRIDDPTVLYEAFSVVVHLRPAPVVARIPLVLPESLQDEAIGDRRRRQELDVSAWLHRGGHPAVPPSPLVPAEPVRRDGYAITFWEFVERDPDAGYDFAGGTVATAAMHAALAEYPGELTWLTSLLAVPAGIAGLQPVAGVFEADDVRRARAEWALLEPVLRGPDEFLAAFPETTIQPVHGDAPAYNVIPTTGGLRWADFEDVGLGPVELDMAGFGPELYEVYDTAAAELGRPGLDRRVLAVMEAARRLQIFICLPLIDRLPVLRDGIREEAAGWRELPLAGGLG